MTNFEQNDTFRNTLDNPSPLAKRRIRAEAAAILGEEVTIITASDYTHEPSIEDKIASSGGAYQAHMRAVETLDPETHMPGLHAVKAAIESA